MRRIALFTLFVLLVAGLTFAQSSTPTTDPNQQPASTQAPSGPPAGDITDKSAAPTTTDPNAAPASTTAAPATDQTTTTTTTSPDANAATTPAPAADQTAAPAADQTAAPAAAADQTTTTTTDQSAAAPAAEQTASKDNAKSLPQTASPLPFLGLLGLGSLAAGFVSRKRQ